MSVEVEMADATQENGAMDTTVENGEPETPALPDDCNFPLRDIDPFSKFNDPSESGASKASMDIPNHHVNLTKNMEKLKNDKDTCDVILRVKKGNFYWASFWAHKSVLSAYSPVFAEALKKFQTYGLPAVETVCRPNLVLPRKIHGAALAALVDWMYTGKLTVHRKALGHLPLVANYLKVQPIIDRLPQIFEDFKESGVRLIDEVVEGDIEVGKENDDNEDEESETKVTKKEEVKEEPDAAEGDAAAPAEEKPKKEWVVNLWLKREVADKLPNIKPIPGFYIMLQSDAHRVKSSRGRKGQDPFDPPEAIIDTNWLASYNQFKAKQDKLVNPRNGRRGGRGGPMGPVGRGMRGGPRGFGPPRGAPRGFGPPRGGGFRGGFRGGFGPPGPFGPYGGGPGFGFGRGFGPRGGFGGPPRGGRGRGGFGGGFGAPGPFRSRGRGGPRGRPY